MACEDDERAGRAPEDYALAGAGSEAGEGGQTPFRQWRARLELLMYETFTNLRISELFDIIVDFPDSLPALLVFARAHTHTSLCVCVCVCVGVCVCVCVCVGPQGRAGQDTPICASCDR